MSTASVTRFTAFSCKGANVTQWSYEPRHAEPPKADRSQWRVMTKHGPLEKGKANPSKYSCLENPMNSTKRQKDATLEDESPRLEGVQYATGEE